MKKFILFVLTALVSVAGIGAEAKSLYTAALHRFEIDALMQEEIGIANINQGSVSVDMKKKEVRLVLAHFIPCSPVACPRYRIKPFILSLPIVKIEKDRCKIPHIHAVLTERRPDGFRKEIEVIMNSKSECAYASSGEDAMGSKPSFGPPPPTVVILTKTGGIAGVRSESRFEGDAMEANGQEMESAVLD